MDFAKKVITFAVAYLLMVLTIYLVGTETQVQIMTWTLLLIVAGSPAALLLLYVVRQLRNEREHVPDPAGRHAIIERTIKVQDEKTGKKKRVRAYINPALMTTYWVGKEVSLAEMRRLMFANMKLNLQSSTGNMLNQDKVEPALLSRPIDSLAEYEPGQGLMVIDAVGKEVLGHA